MRHDHLHLSCRHTEHPPCRGRHRAQIGPLSGEQPEFSQELAGTIRRDDGLPWFAAMLDNVHLAVKDHDQVIGLVTVGKQHIPDDDIMLAAISAQDVELRRIQDRATPCLSRPGRCLAASRIRAPHSFASAHPRGYDYIPCPGA